MHVLAVSGSEQPERFYRLIQWPEDPATPEGFKRYKGTLSLFEQLLKHEWLRELIERREPLRLIDLCSGTGLAGIAFAKVLRKAGCRTELALVDLRCSALEKGREFAIKELASSRRLQ